MRGYFALHPPLSVVGKSISIKIANLDKSDTSAILMIVDFSALIITLWQIIPNFACLSLGERMVFPEKSLESMAIYGFLNCYMNQCCAISKCLHSNMVDI